MNYSPESKNPNNDAREARSKLEQLLPTWRSIDFHPGYVEHYSDMPTVFERSTPRTRVNFAFNAISRVLGRRPESYKVESRYAEIGALLRQGWDGGREIPRFGVTDQVFYPIDPADGNDTEMRHTRALLLTEGFQNAEGYEDLGGVEIDFLEVGDGPEILAYAGSFATGYPGLTRVKRTSITTFLSTYNLPPPHSGEMRNMYGALVDACIQEASKPTV
jgi:hypothetical protein